MLRLATVTDPIRLRCESCQAGLPDEVPPKFVNNFAERIRQLLRTVLDGYFYIGAVRQPHNYVSLRDLDLSDSAAAAKSRHVGAQGEHFWLLERHFADDLMRPVTAGEPHDHGLGQTSEYTFDDYLSGWTRRLVEVGIDPYYRAGGSRRGKERRLLLPADYWEPGYLTAQGLPGPIY